MKKQLQAFLLSAFVSMTFNAHALCVNSDGALDDPSVPPESVVTDVLPVCQAPAGKQSDATQPEQKELVSGKNVKYPADCQMADGTSLWGSIGATEMLPACGI